MRITVLFCILIGASVVAAGQNYDSDYRLCDGMPTSQRAFAMVLASGELQKAAYDLLSRPPHVKPEADKQFARLFTPPPTSILQLMSRVDTAVPSVDDANQLHMTFNQLIASKLAVVAQNDDVVCSISLLSWREASDVFGKRIANQYGVVQVTVRNTDPDHEFLLHQLDFWFGDTLQFFATRDRKIARGVAEKGQVVDPRNLTVRILEGVASVAGASTVVLSEDAKIGASIFSSTVIPAVKYIVPDLTVQQIARLDDMGFSAGASTMVIPKSGAITVVAFIPSDSFLIPKLAQYEAILAEDSTTKELKEACDRYKSGKSTDKADSDACATLEQKRQEPLALPLSQVSMKNAKPQKTGKLFSKPKNIGHFTPATVLLLQRDLHILVSGSHIQQLTVQMAVNKVSCDLGKQIFADSQVTCSLSGNRLDQLAQGRLVNKSDSTVAVSSTGLKAGSDDPANATLSFPACSFTGKLPADFLLETTTARGVSQFAGPAQTLAADTPVLDCSGKACDLKNAKDLKVTKITLKNAQTAKDFTPTAENKITIDGLTPGDYSILLATSDKKDLQLCSTVSVK